jgi:hypothetical protein
MTWNHQKEMMNPDPRALTPANLEHLRLLSIFHYVVGGYLALISLLPLLHVGLGVVMLVEGAGSSSAGASTVPVGLLFTVVGGLVILFGETFAVCTLLAGYYISKRQAWTFCLVVAGFNCLHMPMGTILGIFSLIVLLKPEVKALFQTNESWMG